MRSIFFVALTGCAAGLTEEEAEVVFGAVNDVTGEVYLVAAGAREATWQWEQGDSGFSFSGTLTGGTLWDGTLTITATMTTAPDGTSTEYSFGLDLVDVYVTARDVTLNGTIDQTLTASVTTTSTSVIYDTQAELEVSGAANGSASMSYTLTVEAGVGGYEITAEGDVNGHDVSGFSTSGSW